MKLLHTSVFQWHVVLANPNLYISKANWSLENPFAILLAQLKTVVLIKLMKLAFRLVEYLEHQHLWVRLQAQNSQKYKTLFWNSSVISCSEKLRLFHVRNWLETEDPVFLTRIERGVGGPSAQLSKRTSTLVSSLRNRCITIHLAASLNSTRKTPVSTSTVKRRLRDRHSNVLVLLLNCALGPPTPLSILVRASLFCEWCRTQHCTRYSVSWQFLAWNSLHFSEQE